MVDDHHDSNESKPTDAEASDQATRQSQPPQGDAVNERLRRGMFWALQYWRELFNFRFDKYMIIQVIPGVYGVALTAIGLSLVYLCAEAFMASTWRGVFFLLVGGPLLFLFLATLLRALLEFYMVVFKISEHVDQLVGLRDTVDRLSGIGDSVDEMVSVTRRIPFWRVLAGPRRGETRRGGKQPPDTRDE